MKNAYKYDEDTLPWLTVIYMKLAAHGWKVIKIFTHRIPKFTKIVAEKLATTSTVMEIWQSVLGHWAGLEDRRWVKQLNAATTKYRIPRSIFGPSLIVSRDFTRARNKSSSQGNLWNLPIAKCLLESYIKSCANICAKKVLLFCHSGCRNFGRIRQACKAQSHQPEGVTKAVHWSKYLRLKKLGNQQTHPTSTPPAANQTYKERYECNSEWLNSR